MLTPQISLNPGDKVLVKLLGTKEYTLGSIVYDMGTTVQYLDVAKHLHVAYKRHTVLLKRHHTCSTPS